MNKLVAFYYVEDSAMKQFLQSQLQSVNNIYTDLETELVDSTDSRMSLYASKPDRFPTFILFKNNVRKNQLQAKVNNNVLFNWLANCL